MLIVCLFLCYKHTHNERLPPSRAGTASRVCWVSCRIRWLTAFSIFLFWLWMWLNVNCLLFLLSFFYYFCCWRCCCCCCFCNLCCGARGANSHSSSRFIYFKSGRCCPFNIAQFGSRFSPFLAKRSEKKLRKFNDLVNKVKIVLFDTISWRRRAHTKPSLNIKQTETATFNLLCWLLLAW